MLVIDDQIKNIINETFPISEKSFAEIKKILIPKTYKKGEDFILLNTIDNLEYFLLEGVCKSYIINKKGNEVTLSLFTENNILSPHSIRTSNNRSILNFKALTYIKLAQMDSEKFIKLMIENEEIRNFGNAVMQKELQIKIEKEIGLATLSAKERLNNFRNKYYNLENIIPHTDIASYLGITNISLSRLRKNISK